MILWLVRLLTGATAVGGAGPWLLLAAVVAVGGGGFVAGDRMRAVLDAPAIERLRANLAEADSRTQACVATHEKGRADSAEGVVTALTSSARNVSDAMDALSRKAGARGALLDQLLKDIADATDSHACRDSPPELAFRRRMRGDAAVPAVPP